MRTFLHNWNSVLRVLLIIQVGVFARPCSAAQATLTFNGTKWTAIDFFARNNIASCVGLDAVHKVTTSTNSMVIPYCDDWHGAVMVVQEQKIAGDFTFIARLDSVTFGGTWTWMSMTARDKLESSGGNGTAEHADVVFNPNGAGGLPAQGKYQIKPVTGPLAGTALVTKVSPVQYTSHIGELKTPVWMKLERQGNTFTGYCSNGPELKTWTKIGSTSITLPSVYVGFYCTSAEANRACYATWSNISIATGVTHTAMMPSSASAKPFLNTKQQQRLFTPLMTKELPRNGTLYTLRGTRMNKQKADQTDYLPRGLYLLDINNSAR